MNDLIIVNDWFGLLTIVFGLIFSIYHGSVSVWIFQRAGEEPFKDNYSYNYFWWIYQFWINFLGSATGWFMFFASYRYIRDIGIHKVVVNISFEQLVWILFMTAGLMGFLPMAMSNLSSKLKETFESVLRNKNK